MSDLPNNRLLPEVRYQWDAEFKTLVDLLTDAIARCQFTPTEIREAAILAAIRYEQHNIRSWGLTARDIYPRSIEG
jgi:hypothetical protein